MVGGRRREREGRKGRKEGREGEGEGREGWEERREGEDLKVLIVLGLIGDDGALELDKTIAGADKPHEGGSRLVFLLSVLPAEREKVW